MCFAPQRLALFDISTSKSGPKLVCFVHFDFEMCFAPQRRALFQHLNFQKWSEPLVFLTFWLRNVLRATTACAFSTSQLPKVVRRWGGLCILTWKCASRHNGVQFFISHLASWLRTRRFSEPTFRPSGAPNHWKNSVSRLSYLFAHLHLLSSDLFSSDSFHLCFSTVHIVGSFTSKLPSIIIHICVICIIGRYIYTIYIYINIYLCRSNVVIMRLLLPCSRVCWIWTEASMDLCAFGLLQRLRLARWCDLGSLHSLCGQPQFAASVYTVCQRNSLLRNRLCWVMMCDDIWKALWTSLHPLSLAWRCICPFLTHSAATDWVSSCFVA